MTGDPGAGVLKYAPTFSLDEVSLKRCRRDSPAGGLGVSPISFFISPKSGGYRGLIYIVDGFEGGVG